MFVPSPLPLTGYPRFSFITWAWYSHKSSHPTPLLTCFATMWFCHEFLNSFSSSMAPLITKLHPPPLTTFLAAHLRCWKISESSSAKMSSGSRLLVQWDHAGSHSHPRLLICTMAKLQSTCSQYRTCTRWLWFLVFSYLEVDSSCTWKSIPIHAKMTL